MDEKELKKALSEFGDELDKKLEARSKELASITEKEAHAAAKAEIKAELEKTNNVDAAAYLGTVIAKRAIEKGIKEVVFDRGGFIYQGKVAALADAAREAGLEF